MIKHINHPQDLTDLHNELKSKRLPFKVVIAETAPHKEHLTEYEKKRKQLAYFNRSIVPTYSRASGLREDEAKADLVYRFMSITDDEVESMGGMSNKRLSEVIEQCQAFLIDNFGEQASEDLVLYINKTKKL